MADDYKDKLRKTILTNAGRNMFLQIGDGIGTLVYTRAILTSQKMTDSNGNPLDNEVIANMSSLSDDLKDGRLQISTVIGDHFTVTASFDNKDQHQDIYFNAVGWYARIDTKSSTGQTVSGQEALIAVTPTITENELLGAGRPDGLSTQVISMALNVTISDSANVSMKVNDISYVTRAELDAWQTQIEDTIAVGYMDLSFKNSQGRQLFTHDGNTIIFRKSLIDADRTLSQQGKPADAKATGDAINTAYQQLSHAIGLIMAVLDSLDKNQVIIDIENRLSVLEEQKKETK